MGTSIARCISLVAVLCTTAFSQIHLDAFRAATVRNTWGHALVEVDTVLLSETVDAGVVRSTLTLSLTPGPKRTYSRNSNGLESNPVVLDSIEITTYFSLPPDFAAVDMYLWVEGEKVKAYLQDRKTARAQYESIVNRRKDPAILETRGNGRYYLRIFPCKSFETRKIEMTFVHTLSDSANRVFSSFPISWGKRNYYRYSDEPAQRIKLFYAAARALDSEQYDYRIEGVGKAGFSVGAPALLAATDVKELGNAEIVSSASVDARNGYVWESRERHGNTVFGRTIRVKEADLEFDPEPEARIFVFDIRGTNPEDLSRAQKLAVLSIKRYVGDRQKFNVVVAGQGLEQSQILFVQPQSPTNANLEKAFGFVKGLSSNANSSIEAGIRAGIQAIGNARGGLIILFSDYQSPREYYTVGYETGVRHISNTSDMSDTLDLAKLAGALKASNTMLFGFFRDWRLRNVAYRSGGVGLGVLNTYLYSPPTHTTTAEVDASGYVTVSCGGEDGREGMVYLPPLFGPDSPYGRSGATNLQMKLISGSLLDIGFSYQSGYRYYMDYIVMKTRKADTAIAPVPVPVEENAFTMWVACLTDGPAKAVFELSGEYGRRRFTQKITIKSPHARGGNLEGDAVFGFLKSEGYGYSADPTVVKAVRSLGETYHVVTQQTSLLALEPGMVLWDGEPQTAQGGGSDGNTVTATDAVASAPASESGGVSADAIAMDGMSTSDRKSYSTAGGFGLDEISLDDLIGLEIEQIVEPMTHGVAPLGAKVLPFAKTGRIFRISVQPSYVMNVVTVDLYDALGRRLRSWRHMADQSVMQILWNGTDSRGRRTGGGTYFLRARMGNFEIMRRFVR